KVIGKLGKATKGVVGGEAAVDAILEKAPALDEAGNAAKTAANRVKTTAGQAVAAAKEVAVPDNFTMRVVPEGKLFETLSQIDDQIGAQASGLESLKDPALDVVRKVSEELSDPTKVYDARDIAAIREQLNSQITKADSAARNGHATGDVARYLKQIKSSLDADYY